MTRAARPPRPPLLPTLANLAPALFAAACALVVWQVGWRGVDVPAQVYRAELFRNHGFIAWDSGWYGGQYVLPYSVLFPLVARTVGLYGAATLAAGSATWAFGRMLRRYQRSAGTLGTWLFAVGTIAPVAIGQLPFLCGEATGLLCLVAAGQRRRFLAGGLAAATSLLSPVAGAFLAMAALAWALGHPGERATRLRPLGLAAAAGLPLALVNVRYLQQGRFPFLALTMVILVAACAVAVRLLPNAERVIRIGVVLYAGLAVACFIVPNPLGGNVTRAGVAFGPGLAATLGWVHRRKLLLVLAPTLLIWQLSPAVAGATARTDPSSQRSYFGPLLAALDRGMPLGRVEIPTTRHHREAAYVAPHIPLARGWERQLDIADNSLFYDDGELTAQSYQRWLYDSGVTYVALPDVALDYSATDEAALLRRGLSYLEPIFHRDHWQVWSVLGS
ncbi:MAG: hypothetical protein QOG03_1322, partial [Actinomycetota bacterium]|nr:hypothetical protein [Actinomycetota bacterium]